MLDVVEMLLVSQYFSKGIKKVLYILYYYHRYRYRYRHLYFSFLLFFIFFCIFIVIFSPVYLHLHQINYVRKLLIKIPRERPVNKQKIVMRITKIKISLRDLKATEMDGICWMILIMKGSSMNSAGNMSFTVTNISVQWKTMIVNY